MKILETIKTHPLYIIGALAVVFVGYIWLTSGGSGASDAGASSGDIYAAQNVAGDQLQMASLAAQANQAAIGADLEKTRIGAATSLDIAQLSKELAIVDINAKSASTDLANTLTANVAMSNIKAGVDTTAINANASVANTATYANALVQQAGINASVATASINANAATNAAVIAASSAANKRQCGALSFLFGC